jgi:hypothetical protein
MAFPTNLTNAVDGVTEIVAAHLNNLEAKVGVDGSAVSTSLDYLIKNAASIEPGHKHSKLWTSDGGSVAVTVNASGNVGIGTTNPSQKLEVNGAIKCTPTSAPASPTAGTVYYDSTANKLKVYTGTVWETITSA